MSRIQAFVKSLGPIPKEAQLAGLGVYFAAMLGYFKMRISYANQVYVSQDTENNQIHRHSFQKITTALVIFLGFHRRFVGSR